MNQGTIVGVAIFMAMMSSSAPAQDSTPQQKVLVQYPGKAWAVAIDSPGLVVETREHPADGREYFVANNATSGIVLSVMLEVLAF